MDDRSLQLQVLYRVELMDRPQAQATAPVARLDATNRELFTRALHKYIFFLITMLGVLLQVKRGDGNSSLFDTNYPTVVILIVASILYVGSCISSTACVLQHHTNSVSAEIMTKISLLLGALTVILELVILVPSLGLVALFFWNAWFATFVAEYSWPYVEKAYASVAAAVGHAFRKSKELLKLITERFTKKPEDQTGQPQVNSTATV